MSFDRSRLSIVPCETTTSRPGHVRILAIQLRLPAVRCRQQRSHVFDVAPRHAPREVRLGDAGLEHPVGRVVERREQLACRDRRKAGCGAGRVERPEALPGGSAHQRPDGAIAQAADRSALRPQPEERRRDVGVGRRVGSRVHRIGLHGQGRSENRHGQECRIADQQLERKRASQLPDVGDMVGHRCHEDLVEVERQPLQSAEPSALGEEIADVLVGHRSGPIERDRGDAERFDPGARSGAMYHATSWPRATSRSAIEVRGPT